MNAPKTPWGWMAAALVLSFLGAVAQPPIRFVEWLGALAAMFMAAWRTGLFRRTSKKD